MMEMLILNHYNKAYMSKNAPKVSSKHKKVTWN